VRIKPPQAAAIYTRISYDPSSDRLGVQRQEEDCLQEAKRRGWSVAEVYEDDDRSAHNTKKPRPEYERLLRDIGLGLRDGVMIWRLDRLHRQPRELEEFIVICDKHDVALATVTGDVDLSTSQGRLLARAWGAFAAHESDVKGERLSRAAHQRACRGLMPNTARLYGYSRTTLVVRANEAAVIKEAAARLLKGESLRAVCFDFNRRGIPAAKSGQWHGSTLRAVLMNPRIAGFSTYRGEIVGKGAWRSILSRLQSERVRTLLNDPARRRNYGNFNRYLLRGLLHCTRCGARLIGRGYYGKRKYLCDRRPGLKGCGRLVIGADTLERVVVDQMCHRLDSADFKASLDAARVGDREWRNAHARVQTARRQLETLARDHARGFLTRVEWLAARPALLERVESGIAALDRSRADAVIAEFVGASDRLREGWEEFASSRRHAIVVSLVEQIIVLPAITTRPRSAGERVVIWWRGDHRPRVRRGTRQGISEMRVAGAFDCCSVAGCTQPYRSNGLCGMHVQRLRRHGSPGVAERSHSLPYKGAKCQEVGCAAHAVFRARCLRHYRHWLAHDPSRPRCSVKGCEGTAQVTTLCIKHYQRMRRHGTLER
jgi:site-specific DNA recombinase